MPALESRRVRTQPLTVTGASAGASPARIWRTLNARFSIDRKLLGRATLSSDCNQFSTGLSSPAQADDPVIADASMESWALAITGCPPARA
jgi:hypothetical protein